MEFYTGIRVKAPLISTAGTAPECCGNQIDNKTISASMFFTGTITTLDESVAFFGIWEISIWRWTTNLC